MENEKEKIPTPVPSASTSKENLKDVFFEALNKAGKDLIKSTVNAKSLGIFIIFWLLISLGGSIYRRWEGRCENKIPLGNYFKIDLLCIEK